MKKKTLQRKTSKRNVGLDLVTASSYYQKDRKLFFGRRMSSRGNTGVGAKAVTLLSFLLLSYLSIVTGGLYADGM